LISLKKSSDQFAFSTDDQAGKSFKPFPMRNLRLCREPVGQQAKLLNGDVAALGALQEVGQQVSRDALSSDARHG